MTPTRLSTLIKIALSFLMFSAVADAGTSELRLNDQIHSTEQHQTGPFFSAFGPQYYWRTTKRPAPETANFSVLDPETSYTLHVYFNGQNSHHNKNKKVSSAFVQLNGMYVVMPDDFKRQASHIQKPVHLAITNTLAVELRGKPGSGLTIEIVGIDRDPPTISATASPAPNMAGWNNSDVEVSFSCADATSGVASCPDPVLLHENGADQVVTGTATDRAGNTASASATINIANLDGLSARPAATLLRDLGFTSFEIGVVLSEHFGEDAEGTSRILAYLLFSARDVGWCLRDVYDKDAQGAAYILKLAGFGSGDIADCLMYTFGIEGALPVAQILQNVGFSAFEIGYVLQTIFDHDLDGVSQVLHDLGFTMEHGSAALAALGAKAYPLYDILKTVWELHPIDARLRLVYLGYGEEDIFQVTIGDLAAQYAPQLRFDSGSRENSGRDSYPMSAQEYYNSVIDTYLYLTPHFPVLNPNGNSVNQQQVPTYWRAYRCYSGMPWSSEQIRIIYWWYYGYQDSCDGVSGAHHGDWERIMVTLSEDATMIGAVTYVQHSGHYTRLNVRGGFELIDGTHPVVYVGRANHGSYHNTQTAVQTCCYWEDHRDGQGPWLSTWLAPRIRLQPVEDGGEPWMDVLPGSFTWGYDGISTHPVTVSGEGDNPFTCLMNTCRGTDTWGCQTSGCFRSQCAVGDRDDGVFCRHCAAGWTDMGAHCAKGGSTHEMNVYSFEYLLPLDDWLLFYKSPFWYE